MGFDGIHPLVNIQKAIENGHRNSGYSHKNDDFPWQNVSSPEGIYLYDICLILSNSGSDSDFNSILI